MKIFILQFTTGEKFKINEQEAKTIASANEDQSITLKRLGMVVQKRMCLVYPEHSADHLEERKKQQTGILHDGTIVNRHFGQWVVGNIVPDDNGNYQQVKLDREYYPEVALDCVANEDEWRHILESGKNYYEVLKIKDKIKRLGRGGFNEINRIIYDKKQKIINHGI